MSKGLRRSIKRTIAPLPLEARVALSSANILAMFGTPVTLLPAPGAGKTIIVESILFKMTRTSTAYAGGGAVTFKYAGGASLPSTIAATVVTTGGAGTEYNHVGDNGASLTPTANAGIQITNGTAAFTTGTGTADIVIKYRVVAL